MPMLRRPLKREKSILIPSQVKANKLSTMGLVTKNPAVVKNRIIEKAKLLNSYKQQYYEEILKIGLIKQKRGDSDIEILEDFEKSPPKEIITDESKPMDHNIEEVMFGINPPKIVNCHIKLLKEYNEVRDIALGFIGMISEQRGIRVKDVLEEMGVEIKD
ncbi:hypothetical protein NADFUDRAFT_47852 [Nadsonia fulvescens var. elongata DSM 6958]|uniref:Swi5-domain-containing protein n=1 Tax=Nadsonia fulvescens var. elongata DSM 6958 TaxID=857566 RepID=A0A1E3PEX5_9ASCO|nr:hypothetical protein NADFUDRAFT_47852 [Nadsonia fulvescens var. elongata DSM 6958]